jgi:hypothetical protein
VHICDDSTPRPQKEKEKSRIWKRLRAKNPVVDDVCGWCGDGTKRWEVLRSKMWPLLNVQDVERNVHTGFLKPERMELQ